MLKENFYKIKNFGEELEKIYLVSENLNTINYISQGKVYLKNSTKKILLERAKTKLKELMEHLSPMNSKSYLNQENFVKHLKSFQFLSTSNLSQLLQILREFLRENNNPNSIFMNNISSPFSIYLLRFMFPEAIKFALVDQENSNSAKIDIIYRTRAEKLMKSVK